MMMQNVFRAMAQDAVATQTCNTFTGCGKVVDDSEFTDEISLREYKIAGLCQKCQDRIYALLEPEDI